MAGTGWTPRPAAFYAAHMPTLNLNAAELADAAQAARLASRQAQRDADVQQNPRIKASFAADAERYKALGEKFQQARR
jgi:hypothetical protein